MATIYISLGSNINREENTRAGVEALRQAFGELKLSSVYESESVGFEGDAFYNMVIACEVNVGVHECNKILGDIEDANGRDRSGPKFSSRTLDLDLLLYDDRVLNENGLILPRGEILKNAFVLWPLAEIAPDLIHPETGIRIKQLWSAFDKTKENLKPIDFGFGLADVTEINAIPCDLFVDISGNDCTQPDSKLNDALEVLLPAQTLMAVADRHALHCDVPAFCQRHNLQLIGDGLVDEQLYYLIRLPDK